MNKLEEEKFKFEYYKIKLDIYKWAITGVFIIIGFILIKPQEQSRLDRELKLEIHRSYLSAVETENIDLWQRKLNLLKAITSKDDDEILNFLRKEQENINQIRDNKVEYIKSISKKNYLENKIESLYEELLSESNNNKSETERLLAVEIEKYEKIASGVSSINENLKSSGIQKGEVIIYSIQIMTLKNSSSVAAIVKVFKNLGYDIEIIANDSNTPSYYKILLGKYSTIEEAVRFKKEITRKHELFKDSFVTQRIIQDDDTVFEF